MCVCVCVYIYISPPLHARYGLNRLVEEVKHRIFIWWKGKLRAATYLLVRSAWIGVTSICGLLTREIDGRRGEIVEGSFSSFPPLFSFLSVLSIEVRYDTT